jgi:predicted peroxiredoxin
MASRRTFLKRTGHSCAGLAAGIAAPPAEPTPQERQRYLLIGLNGSENPTRANFPFAWASALADAGHEVRIELAGDGVVLMRTVVADNLHPVGWPPFSEALPRVVAHGIPIFV